MALLMPPAVSVPQFENHWENGDLQPFSFALFNFWLFVMLQTKELQTLPWEVNVSELNPLEATVRLTFVNPFHKCIGLKTVLTCCRKHRIKTEARRNTWAVARIDALLEREIVVQVFPAAAEVELLALLRGGVVVPARERAATRPHLHRRHTVVWQERRLKI